MMQSFCKRVMDIVCALLGLMVTAPLWVIIFLWIKCTSPGPVFFIHTRVGRHGRLFGMLKFRSMVVTQKVVGQLQITSKNDPRITRVGAFLRHYKLDELPQLWNVLVGQMSLVGPRPEVPQYMARYTQKDRDMMLSVKPGITDLASIRFRHEETILAQYNDPLQAYFDHVLPKKLRYMRFYITHASLGYDIRLIFDTLRIVLHKG